MTFSDGLADNAGAPPDAALVRRLIESGDSRKALEIAKSLHKRAATPDNESLLIEAYTARVRAMSQQDMEIEADAMISMLRLRFPASASAFEALRRRSGESAFDKRMRPLADPAATPEDRAAAEHFIRTSLTDLTLLAQCQSLPAGHPLRAGAEAILGAFNAVTTRRVDDDELVLPEISRRGPLAPWKFLVRAIACYYRYEDAACAEHLRAIDPESVPARLVHIIETMMSGGKSGPSKSAAWALAQRAGGSLGELLEALAAIDRAFRKEGKKRITAAVRNAVGIVQSDCPEILTAFRQQVAVRLMMHDIPPKAAAQALNGQPKDDAQFWLMAARTTETVEELAPMACHMWNEFRRAAVSERWFPERGPESATLYLHMAEVAAKIDGPDDDDYDEPADGRPDVPYMRPHWLFEQACAMDPTPDTFRQWVDWAERKSEPRQAEVAAAAWRRALPEDPRPLLRLMRYAEDRNALKKALGFLRQAEVLDGVNTEVRRARLRLLISGALRHLKQRKPHLAAPELAELEELPQARENDRPAFLAALRFVAAQLVAIPGKANAAAAQMHDQLGSARAAGAALVAVGSLCDMHLPLDLHNAGGEWMAAIPRVISMGQDLGFRFDLPSEWKAEIFKELKQLQKPDPIALERLGAAAQFQRWDDVSFQVAARGLELGPAWEHRFLLLRAKSIPQWDTDRREQCLLAAITLAKRANDPRTAAEATSLWRETTVVGHFGMEPPVMGHRDLQKVLQHERRSKEWHPSRYYGPQEDVDPRSLFEAFVNEFGAKRRGRRRRREPSPFFGVDDAPDFAKDDFGDDDVPF